MSDDTIPPENGRDDTFREAEEFTRRTHARIRERLDPDDYRAVLKLTRGKAPPNWQMIVFPIVVSALLAISGAALALWRNDAVTSEREHAAERLIMGVDRDLREHTRAASHPGTAAGLARIESQTAAINARLDRIERQLDAARRGQR